MPKFLAAALFVEMATKCLATARSPKTATSHARAAPAFSKVSDVAKDLEATIKSVEAGFASSRTS